MIRLAVASVLLVGSLGCGAQKGVEFPKDSKVIVASTSPVQK
jgi:hypothetical protein